MVNVMAEADQIKILFMDGSWVNFNKPPNFDLIQFTHGARSLGMIITPQFYVPMQFVKLIMDMSAAHVVEFGTTGTPIPTVPGTETRQ